MKQIFIILIVLMNSLLSEENTTIKLRFTAVSVPIEIVQNNNLNFFPDRFGNSNKLMTNKEFNALLSKLLTHKDVYKLFDSSELAVSGKTFVTRNCEELFLPESYSPIRETSKNSNLSISINHLTKPEDSQKGKKAAKQPYSASLVQLPENGPVTGIQADYGEPRDMGLVIEATPIIEPDGINVTIDLRPQLLSLQGWRDYNQQYSVKMPLIRSITQESRFTLTKGMTFINACLYDESLPANMSQFTGKASTTEQCILLFTSVDSETNEEVKAWKPDTHILYSNINIEIPDQHYARLKFRDGKFLQEESVKSLLEMIKNDDKTRVLSVNSGITQNGNTAITRNVNETPIPETYESYTIKGNPVTIPKFEDYWDMGSVMEITPQVDPNNFNIEVELKPQSVKLTGWQQKHICNGLPIMKASIIDTRVITENGQILLLSTNTKTNGFTKPQDRKTVLSLFYVELR